MSIRIKILAFLSICFLGQVCNAQNPDVSSTDLPNMSFATLPMPAEGIEGQWQRLKMWKSINSERYNLIVDYSDPSTHEMVIKGRFSVFGVAQMLEKYGMATFRMSFTLVAKCTPDNIETQMDNVSFDYYITSEYINYSSVGLDELEMIRDELLGFVRLGRRYGNPVHINNDMIPYMQSSPVMANIYSASEDIEKDINTEINSILVGRDREKLQGAPFLPSLK